VIVNASRVTQNNHPASTVYKTDVVQQRGTHLIT